MTENEMNLNDTEALARKCVAVCEEKKAANIVLFDVSRNSELADYYLICCGTSLPHLRALADSLRRELTDQGLRPRGQDGAVSSQWIVMDYGSILIHIMSPEMRTFYGLEDLWDKRLIVFQGGEPMPPVREIPADDVENDYDADAVNAAWTDDEEFDEEGDGEFDEEEYDEEEFDEEDDGEFEDDDFEDDGEAVDGEFDDYAADEQFPEVMDEDDEKAPAEDKPREKPDKGYSLDELFGNKK